MVVNAFLNVLKTVLVWGMGMMPQLGVPDWLSSSVGTLSGYSDQLASTTGFIPWSVLGGAVAIAISAVGVSVAIRGIRIALSFLTLGGGS